MAIFTRRFANADEYEEFLANASGRVNVLKIVKQPTVNGSTSLAPAGPVTLKYQTHDKSLAPPRSTSGRVVEYAVIGAAFFALFAYVIGEL
jgi:hypothetical protein